MSKKGIKETIIKKINIKIENKNNIKISGKFGNITKNKLKIEYFFLIIKKNKKLFLYPKIWNKNTKLNWCTYKTIISNLIKGINKQYKEIIILKGIEYSIKINKNIIIIKIGFSKKVKIKIPKSIKINYINKKEIEVNCCNLEKLGNFIGKLKKIRKYNLYKDKGIRKKYEVIKLKEIKNKK
ncbi:MAG: hypothetical protein AAYR31_00615 [Candidatus Vidania fulgoroideorum]